MSIVNVSSNCRSLTCKAACTAVLGGLLLSSNAQANLNAQTAFVPDDSFYYFGTGAPHSVADLVSLMPSVTPFDIDDVESIDDPSLRNLASGYIEFIKDPVKKVRQWGIDDQLSMSLYQVGVSPVLRVAVSDAQKILKQFERLREEHQLSVVQVQREGGEYRLFRPLAQDTKGNDTSAQPKGAGVFGIVGNDAVFSFIPDAEDFALADRIVGLVTPEKSIATSGRLSKLREKWNYLDDFIGFADFVALASALTNPQSPTGKQLNQLSEGKLAALHTESCAEELQAIAKTWPMWVAGYRRLELKDGSQSGINHMAMEINHTQLTDTLQLLGGTIPGQSMAVDPMFGVGFGLDVNKFGQAFGQLSQLINGFDYDCESLSGLNGIGAEALGGVSMGVMMFSGMARGVLGLSANVFEVDLDVEALSRGMPDIKTLDLAISIAAEDAGSLVQTLQMMPNMQSLGAIPTDGSSVALSELSPVPVPAEFDAQVAIKGKNVVLYRGDAAQKYATELAKPTEVGDSFLHFRVNLETFVDSVGGMMESVEGLDEDGEMTKMLEMLRSYPKGTSQGTVKFTPVGIEYNGTFEFEAR